MNESTNLPPGKRRYVWPWFVAAFLIVGVILSVLAVRSQMEKVRKQREFQMPSSAK
ncbi:MAG: hypothetical protein U1F83_17320 [Verrucomicrobiota bacterium]